MSMYSQMLLNAQATREAPDGSNADLVSQLHELRGRLPQGSLTEGAGPGDMERGVPDVVAAHLTYDLVLMELCKRVGIHCDLARYERPLIERLRLEGELQHTGIMPGSSP